MKSFVVFQEPVPKHIVFHILFLRTFSNTLYVKGWFLYEIMSFEVNEDRAQHSYCIVRHWVYSRNKLREADNVLKSSFRLGILFSIQNTATLHD